MRSHRQVKQTQLQIMQRNHIDNRLVNFGESICCDKKYHEDGMNLAISVFNRLRHSKYNTVSFHIGGSFGKKTDVIEPDLDLVVLVDNCHPPLDDALEDFKYILRCVEDDLKIRPGVYKKTELSLNFSFTNGIAVDLISAANIEEKKIKKVFKEMKHHKYAYFYNPSFVKDQVAFMRAQDSFTHTLVRISKFWLKSLYLGERFNGGSAMMELIAVAAAEDSKKSASQAFMKVLKTIMNLRSTKLAFFHYTNERNIQKWKTISPDDLRNNNHHGLVPNFIGKYEILQRKCFMIDPANPFQDFLEGKTDSVLERLSEFAQITYRRLELILNGYGIYDKEIQQLFDPLPEVLKNDDENGKPVSLPKNVLLTYDEVYDSVYNEVKIFNEEINIKSMKAHRRAVDILKNHLLTVIHSTVKGKSGKVTKNDVRNAVLQLIKKNPRMNLKQTSNRYDHNWYYDARIRVPYLINRTGYAVCLSMTWKSSFPISQKERSLNKRGCVYRFCRTVIKILLWIFIVLFLIVYMTK